MLCLAFVLDISAAPVARADGNSVAAQLGKWKEKEPAIVFYGQVIDQEGNPVEAATVHVNVPEQTGFRKQAARRAIASSSEDGSFVVDAKLYGVPLLRGSFLIIDKVEKEHCQYVAPILPLTLTYRLDRAERFIPDKNTPVTFSVRRQSDNQSFLVCNDHLRIKIETEESGHVIGYDCIQQCQTREGRSPASKDNPLLCDLQVKATFNENDATWETVLSPGNTNGGIIVSEQLLYEAPEAEYQPEYTFTPEDRKPVKAKYVYLKSRDPAIYTRLEIEYINANKQFFRLSGKSVTNPYGDRILDQATDLPYEVTKQLTDEAKTSFRKDKRPTKPDLPKLIKQAKEKGKP
jgi:hypothetical protein